MHKRPRPVIFFLFFAALLVFLLQDCKSAKTVHDDTSGYRNLSDTVSYVGMQQCRSCHEEIYQSYMKTGMGQSFDVASRSKSSAVFGKGRFVYDSSINMYYKPFLKEDSLYISEFRIVSGDTVHKRIEKIDHIIGSGHHTNSHMCSFNDYLYQAPITFYTQDERWDLAPGFSNGNNSRFSRAIEMECMSCHNAYPEADSDAFNKYAKIARGIDCERCHGPGEIHVKEKLAGKIVDTSRYIDYSIVNPSKLTRSAQMSLCQRCHLQGVSVLQEGKDFMDFKPSMELSEVMEVFIPRFEGEKQNFIMASHADRLKLSECYNKSEMTCISCHNPHISVRLSTKEMFNLKCNKCHESQLDECKLDLNSRLSANENDCVACHMPSSGSIDIPHVQIHDHFIRIPEEESEKVNSIDAGQFKKLACITSNDPGPIMKARAYLAYYEKFNSDDIALLDSVEYYLKTSNTNHIELEIHMLFLREDYFKLTTIGNERKPNEWYKDPYSYYRIGEAFNRTGEFEKALKYIDLAVELKKEELSFLIKQATVLMKLNRREEAKKVLYQLMGLHPKLPVVYTNLGIINMEEGEYSRASYNFEKAISLDPDHKSARLNFIKLMILKGDRETALHQLNIFLDMFPNDIEANRIKISI